VTPLFRRTTRIRHVLGRHRTASRRHLPPRRGRCAGAAHAQPPPSRAPRAPRRAQLRCPRRRGSLPRPRPGSWLRRLTPPAQQHRRRSNIRWRSSAREPSNCLPRATSGMSGAPRASAPRASSPVPHARARYAPPPSPRRARSPSARALAAPRKRRCSTAVHPPRSRAFAPLPAPPPSRRYAKPLRFPPPASHRSRFAPRPTGGAAPGPSVSTASVPTHRKNGLVGKATTSQETASPLITPVDVDGSAVRRITLRREW